MSLRDAIIGKPLASSEGAKEELTVLTGVPVLGLDALASTGYGPEAALAVLLPLGTPGLRYFPFIVFGIVALLLFLFLSYQQTAGAYPGGGGAYTVAKDNLGVQAGIWAAAALLLDYMLNVAVGIAAGVGAVVSAVPMLHSHILALCLLVLLTLTLANLRGIRETGLIFTVPVFVFVGSIGAAIAIGSISALQSGGHPHPVTAPPPLPEPTASVSPWLLLAAFANGCTAMTGIEAVSNGVPYFRDPKVRTARRTLTAIAAILGLCLLGLGYVCPAYHIGAMDEREPGYQAVLTQLIAAVAGQGVFYYAATASIFIVLTYSAQTSFADFPRVCRLLAEDDFLPHPFANRGRRLGFSYGIIILAILSAVILIAFRGVTERLIPLFAVGAFSAFLFSQAGMVVHWLRRPGRGTLVKLTLNAIGAAATACALGIIILAKFAEGAWLTVVVVPGLVLLLNRINRRYRKVNEEIAGPLKLEAAHLENPAVIVPVDSWNRAAEKALRFGLLLSDDVTALHISTERDPGDQLKRVWKEKVEAPARDVGTAIPHLEMVESPYRKIYAPILEFINRVKEEKPGRLIAVVIPELVEPHWYEYLLHNLHGARLRAGLFMARDDRTIVITTPWYLRG